MLIHDESQRMSTRTLLWHVKCFDLHSNTKTLLYPPSYKLGYVIRKYKIQTNVQNQSFLHLEQIYWFENVKDFETTAIIIWKLVLSYIMLTFICLMMLHNNGFESLMFYHMFKILSIHNCGKQPLIARCAEYVGRHQTWRWN